ncbi:M48 family metallopeptidase [Rhodanobacter ginsengisoli]|uniref:M48 family metallopeptidase n=1 Tax=Rhodanobacter ginsengisoli TaxID=418646 RepID=A0ABW0QSL9_9GAMM
MDFAYTVQRSGKRRKLTIVVERDRTVVVHAPMGATDEAIRQVVEAKRHWIFEKRKDPRKYRDLPHPPGKELVNGESALYLGRQYRVEVVAAGLDAVQFNQRFLVPASKVAKRKMALREWYIARANEKILPRVSSFARSLGVEFQRARIVDNRYRWGSCTIKDSVNFNWRLIKAPTFVIDYVIAHELAHLIEANHTARFWNVVRAQVPKVEEARVWLREQGQALEEEV